MTAPPLRLVHLVPRDGIGGVEVAAKAMRAAPPVGCRFDLVFIDPRAAARPRGLARLGAAIRHLAAVRAVLRLRPDVLVCSLWKSVPVGLAVRALRPRTRLVFFLHSERPVHRLDAAWSRVGMWAAAGVWADSAATLARRRPPARAKTAVISLVASRLAPRRAPVLAPSFVAWGRLTRQKGVDRALALIAALHVRGVPARFTVYGPDGGERNALEVLARRMGLVEFVRFPGPVARAVLPDIAANHAFFLQLSRYEGMCMAAVEAMQLGLVPVVTPVGEMARYVVPGENGLHVDPDRPEPALATLIALLSDPARYQALSQAARRRWRDAPLYPDAMASAASALVRG